MALIDFDANKVEPLGEFAPLPVGEYLVIITETEIKEAKSGNGKYLQLVYEVVDGQYKGRKIFDRLNIVNNNVTAQEIAQKALSSICRAVGVLTPKDSEELHNKPLTIGVGIRPASGEYGESNIVKKYSAALTTVKAPAPTSLKKPWEQ